MTRKQAEKIASAIRIEAERAGFSAINATREKAEVNTTNVATALKKESHVVESALENDGPAIWGCLPMGWNLTRRGMSGLVVYRPAR